MIMVSYCMGTGFLQITGPNSGKEDVYVQLRDKFTKVYVKAIPHV